MVESTARKRIVRSAHATADCTELVVFLLRQETTLKVWRQMLADDLSLTTKRERNHYEHKKESGDHYQDIHQYESGAAKNDR